MKNKVIEFFQNLPENKPEQFNKAFELYRASPMKSESVERVLNASGFSDTTLNNLLYDLQKMHGISDIEKLPLEKEKTDFRLEILDKVIDLTHPNFQSWLNDHKDLGLNMPELIELATENENDLAVLVLCEISEFKEKVDFLDVLINTSTPTILKDFEDNITPTKESLESLLEFAVSINNEKAIEKINEIILSIGTAPNSNTDKVNTDELSQKNNDLENQNEDLTIENEELVSKNDELEVENETLKNQIHKSKTLPVINAESIRVEFPFLNSKDCPNELKILVADKITAWNEYLLLHDEVLKAEAGEITLSKEELESKAKRSIDCFDENQKIYEELNAYQETGQVLGKHPIFRTLRLTREVEEMTPEELFKYKNSTSKFFTDNKKKLVIAEKENDLEKIEEINEKISARNEKLQLVDKKLGISK